MLLVVVLEMLAYCPKHDPQCDVPNSPSKVGSKAWLEAIESREPVKGELQDGAQARGSTATGSVAPWAQGDDINVKKKDGVGSKAWWSIGGSWRHPSPPPPPKPPPPPSPPPRPSPPPPPPRPSKIALAAQSVDGLLGAAAHVNPVFNTSTSKIADSTSVGINKLAYKSGLTAMTPRIRGHLGEVKFGRRRRQRRR